MSRGRRPIDLAAVRKGRADLDRLAKEHPELLGSGSKDGWESILQDDEERMAATETRMTTFRLEPELIKRLDAAKDRMNDETPGLRLNRTGALRVLLTRALDAEETRRGPGKRHGDTNLRQKSKT